VHLVEQQLDLLLPPRVAGLDSLDAVTADVFRQCGSATVTMIAGTTAMKQTAVHLVEQLLPPAVARPVTLDARAVAAAFHQAGFVTMTVTAVTAATKQTAWGNRARHNAGTPTQRRFRDRAMKTRLSYRSISLTFS